ncbi:MAG: ribosome-binding factor [Bryobacterales bacterium]|nr:ribosome-binding factor [Bryobacterales bacterium]
MDKRRTARVSEAVREELSEIINFEMSDPRVKGVTVAEVSVTPDGRQARVSVAVFGDADQQEEALAGLNHARAHLRHQLAGRLQLRHVPELTFTADTGMDATNRVEVLLARVRKNKRGPENSSET